MITKRFNRIKRNFKADKYDITAHFVRAKSAEVQNKSYLEIR